MSRHDGLRLDLALVADQIFDGSRVLDLGCGEGVLLEHLMATRGCRGTGVEIDADAVLVAIRRGVQGEDLETLNDTVQSSFVDMDEQERVARSALSRLEAGIVRRFGDLRKPKT